MKSLYEKNALTEITDRINKLTPESQRLWGKMDVAQMMAHCTVALEMASGQRKTDRIFIGRILGPFFKASYSNDKPAPKNSPTGKEFIMVGEKDFDLEKKKLIEQATQFSEAGPDKCTTHPHSFFGKLSTEEWSKGMYKHLDHHLKQFGV